MKRIMRYAGLLACLAAVAFVILLLIDTKRLDSVAVTMLGWTATARGAETNQYAVIQITNRTARTMAIALGVEALNRHGLWEPVPENLVFERSVANTVLVLPGRSLTNLTLKWLPERASTWRVIGDYDKVLSQREGAAVRLIQRFGLRYPFAGPRLPLHTS